MANSLILNIPHSSSYVPEDDIMRAFLPHGDRNDQHSAAIERENVIKQELLLMTDWYTDELFDHSIGKAVIAPVSRLVCDVERFSHDEQESMASRGMGFCYEKGSMNQEIKDCTAEYKDETLWRYYAPHHIALTDAVESALARSQRALVLDCHSFSPEPLPYEPMQSDDRPEICIGTDEYHTSRGLTDAVVRFFRKRKFSVSLNNPYSGTIVPLRYYRKDKRVQSIMIEVNRGLYLEPGTSDKSAGFQRIMKTLFDLEIMLSLGCWNE